MFSFEALNVMRDLTLLERAPLMDLSNCSKTKSERDVSKAFQLEDVNNFTFQCELRSDLTVRDELIERFLQRVAERCVSVELVGHSKAGFNTILNGKLAKLV